MHQSIDGDCGCGNPTITLPVRSISLNVDASGLAGDGVTPGPDATHLVSRNGELVWEPISDGGPAYGNYSSVEQWTGKLWLDGKKVYRKTIDCGAMPDTSGKTVPVGVPNIDFVIDLAGTTLGGDGEIYTLPRGTYYPAGGISCTFKNGQLKISTGADFSHCKKTFVTLWYTCTDR